jgi:hypothetical protein
MSIGRIESAVALGAAILVVIWDDGIRREIDFEPIIALNGMLAALRDPQAFRGLRIAEDGWSVEWHGSGIDVGSAQLRRWADEQAGEAKRKLRELVEMLRSLRVPGEVEERQPIEFPDRPGLY